MDACQEGQVAVLALLQEANAAWPREIVPAVDPVKARPPIDCLGQEMDHLDHDQNISYCHKIVTYIDLLALLGASHALSS